MSHFARLIPHCFRNLALQLGHPATVPIYLLTLLQNPKFCSKKQRITLEATCFQWFRAFALYPNDLPRQRGFFKVRMTVWLRNFW